MKYIEKYNIYEVENIEDIDRVFDVFKFKRMPTVDRLPFYWPTMNIPTEYSVFRNASSIWVTVAVMIDRVVTLTSTADSKSTYVVIDTESELYSNVADVIRLDRV